MRDNHNRRSANAPSLERAGSSPPPLEHERDQARAASAASVQSGSGLNWGLADHEALLSEAQEAAEIGVWSWNLKTDGVEWCPRLYRLLGLAPNSVPASASFFFSLVHPEDRAKFEAALRKISEEPQQFQYEFRIVRPDGSVRWLLSRARHVYDQVTGELVRMVGINMDITDRKAAEAELRAVSAELRRTLDTAGAGLTRCSRDLRYLSANPAYARLVGLPLDQIIGRPIVEVMGEAAFELIRPYVERVLRGERIEYETELRYGSGHPKWIHVVYTSDRDDHDNILGWVASVTDISDRKSAEQDLRRAKAEAERASIDKTHFLATASHDLRQPLQALVLSLALLAIRTRNNEPLARLVANANSAAAGLSELVNALLDVALLDAGGIQPRTTDFPVAETLDAMREEFEEIAAKKALSFEVKPCGAVIRSDPALLGRMMRNLISNAVKYTPSGGQVTVNCSEAEGSRLEIAVADTGVGIPEDQHAAVFEDFRQLDNPERDRSEGLGLGLPIVARTARLLEHPVSLHSAPGRGTVFTVAVPLGDEVEPVKSGGLPEVHGAGRILLVEDEELAGGLIREILEGAGFEVLFARSAEAAFRLIDGIEAGHRSLSGVVADYRLPNLTGLHVVDAARRRFPNVSAVILTGDTFHERLNDIHALRIRLLRKPVGLAALIDTMAVWAAATLVGLD